MNPMHVTPVTLRGTHVELAPYRDADAPELFHATPPDTFAFYLDRPETWDVAGMAAYMQGALADPARQVFVIREMHDGRAGRIVGCSSYLDIQPKHRNLEIGATWYAADCRGTPVNPESKLLMLRHAFETLGCLRVLLKCDGRNLRSRRAIAKLGAVHEGVLRRHRITWDGTVRDTFMFSILDTDWPRVKAGLELRLGP